MDMLNEIDLPFEQKKVLVNSKTKRRLRKEDNKAKKYFVF